MNSHVFRFQDAQLLRTPQASVALRYGCAGLRNAALRDAHQAVWIPQTARISFLWPSNPTRSATCLLFCTPPSGQARVRRNRRSSTICELASKSPAISQDFRFFLSRSFSSAQFALFNCFSPSLTASLPSFALFGQCRVRLRKVVFAYSLHTAHLSLGPSPLVSLFPLPSKPVLPSPPGPRMEAQGNGGT